MAAVASIVREVTFGGLLLGALFVGAWTSGCAGVHERAEPAPRERTDASGTPQTDCVPYADDCPPATYCQYVDGRTRCVEEGTVARDQDCNMTGRCQRGSICMYGGFYGAQCQQPCPLVEGFACDIRRHTCFAAVEKEGGPELPFGVCRY